MSAGCAVRDSLKAVEGVRILANEEYQRGGLRIGFGATLLPFLEGSQIDAQWAGEHGT